MKKVISLFLCIFMMFAFASCGKESDTSAADNFVFTSVTLEGEDVDSSIFEESKLTMVNIWATFCSPCINEMPELQKLSEDYKDKGVQIVGMVCDVTFDAEGNFDEDLLAKAKAIVEETGVKYQNILPSQSLNEIKLNDVYSVPETFFVDEKGNVVGESYIGSRSYDQWAEIIDYVLTTVE